MAPIGRIQGREGMSTEIPDKDLLMSCLLRLPVRQLPGLRHRAQVFVQHIESEPKRVSSSISTGTD